MTYYLSFPIFSRIEIKTRKPERKLKQEKMKRNGNHKHLIKTTYYLVFKMASYVVLNDIIRRLNEIFVVLLSVLIFLF